MTNMIKKIENKELEFTDESLSPDRPNRLCVSLSDIHLTDGSVGFQNLKQETWDAFYACLAERCRRYDIKEMTLVLDGDVIDMIRSAKWAENEVYPWERDREEDFSRTVNQIIREIVDVQHKDFFKWLQDLPKKLEQDAAVNNVDIIITLGNHDKELYCDQEALIYFYEKGLGQELDKISDKTRRMIGRMYGDEDMFVDVSTAPYFPFYFADKGFRFFTTHGQWRDRDNSRKVKATENTPAWSAKNGWQNETWKKLKFSPFFSPCFGDTVAAGILSTFIYKTKKSLESHNIHDDRLNNVLDELDLYRPTYKALTRILDETKFMRSTSCDHNVIKIIEGTLYSCIMDWLSWSFTYESSPMLRRIGLRFAKIILKLMKYLHLGLEIKAIASLMKILSGFSHLNPFHKTGVSFKEMKKFPAFLQAYKHYGFQIHGEGHTHEPLIEEPNFEKENYSTYVNFGTWRDQIVGRKVSGYRRRSILREFYILDLKDTTKNGNEKNRRSFDYFTNDIIAWSDKSDELSKVTQHQPHI